jgi:hypothetical protein
MPPVLRAQAHRLTAINGFLSPRQRAFGHVAAFPPRARLPQNVDSGYPTIAILAALYSLARIR